jgi:predicted branched-subunit amino acid permease
MLDIQAQRVMKENNPSKFGRLMFYLLFLIWVASVVINIKRGHVNHPGAFGLAIVGLFLFLTAKITVIRRKEISFGTSLMSEGMANLYRVGYWLMVVGILVTFT